MTRSLSRRLFFMVLLCVLSIWSSMVAFTWWRTIEDIHQVFDNELTLVAQLLEVATRHEGAERDISDYETDLNRSGVVYPLVFQIWSDDHRLLVRGPKAPTEPIAPLDLPGHVDSHFGGHSWRVYTRQVQDGKYLVQVARDHTDLNARITQFVLNVVKPMLLALPLLAVLWFGIHRGLHPLHDLGRRVGQRGFQNLVPLPEQAVPTEISALVKELNGLFARLQGAIERNRRFTGDAAHELRTPIAGALIQLKSIELSRTPEEREHAIGQVRLALTRLNHVVDQLLTLASIEPERLRTEFEAIELEDLATEVIAQQHALADAQGVSLELEAEPGIGLVANRQLIAILLGNLLSNAINAAPRVGWVRVRLRRTDESVWMVVEDNGPGIPDGRKEWAFERFNRLPDAPVGGSGLGLSIVREIVRLHQATIQLLDPEEGTGLCVRVVFDGKNSPILSES